MKKNLIIILALGLFLASCQNSGRQPEARSGKSVTKLSAQLLQPGMTCITYSIFNPQGPAGPAVHYSCIDCIGGVQTGSVDPQETINVLGQPGTVKCPGGVVTEVILKLETDPAHLRP
jgi:hypothetical protein